MKKLFYLLILLALISCGKEQEKIDEDKIHASTAENTPIVEIEVLKPQTWYTEILSQGKLQALQKANLRFKATGKLQQINVQNGQKVHKNQLMASLDSSESLLALEQAELAFQKTKTERYIQLIQRAENGDTASVNPRKKNVVALTSGYASAFVGLQQAKYNFAQTKLYAPFSGRIANLFIQNYNYINPSEVFCTLINDSKFYLDFKILDLERSKVIKNMPVSIHPLLSEDKKYTGKIVEINPLVDKNGMINIRALVPFAPQLIDGMQMQVSIRQSTPKQLVVPKSAVVDRSGKTLVFIYKEGLAKWRYVKINGENAQSYHISEGLNLGDTLIISNNFNLVHDSEVKLKND